MYNITIGVDKPDINRLKSSQERIMQRGIKVKNIEELRRTFNSIRDNLKESIEEKYDIRNINSAPQIGAYLQRVSSNVAFGEVNDYIESCYKDGKWVTDQYSMNKLSALGYQFADDLLEYRDAKSDAEKINSIADNLSQDGRIHSVVSLAKTNRVNYSKPALGQIRKELIRYIIEPLNDGEEVYSIDIKNQEPSILINALGDKELLKALESEDGLYNEMFKWVFKPFTEMTVLVDTLPEDRIYNQRELQGNIMIPVDSYCPMEAPCISWKVNGKQIKRVQRVCQGITYKEDVKYPETVVVEFTDGTVADIDVEWEEYKRNSSVIGWLKNVDVELTKQERKEFKTSFLAITYGASSLGIERQCKIIDAHLLYKKVTSLKGMAEYRKRCGKAASNGITTMSTLFGTPVSTDKTSNTNELKRSLLSIPIQGTGADILDLLMTHFDKEAKAKFGDEAPYIYFTRHDEIMICVKKELVSRIGEDAFKQWLNECMEHRINNSTVFRVEISKLEDITLEELLSK